MELLKSKKFWISVAGILAVVLSTFLGVPEQTTLEIAGIIIAYVLGQGIADSGKSVEMLKKKK